MSLQQTVGVSKNPHFASPQFILYLKCIKADRLNHPAMGEIHGWTIDWSITWSKEQGKGWEIVYNTKRIG
jgi:hypothetical protein